MKILYVDNSILNVDTKLSFLTADCTAADSTLTVESIIGFEIDQILLIGELGHENSEIIKTHAATDPSGTTITLVSGTTFNHNRGTKVYLLDWDQFEIFHDATVLPTAAAFATISAQVDQKETIYKDTTYTDGYYFTRLKNSITSVVSDYSDPIPFGGYADNSVAKLKEKALNDLGEKRSEDLTDEWLNSTLWEARRELDQDESVSRWSFRIKNNANIGSIIPGTYTFDLPTDLRRPETNQHILSLRVGENSQSLEYQDINTFNSNYYNIKHTTLNGAVLFGAVTITLTDSGDFDESGSIYIAGASVSDTIDTVAYTANSESTNVLSGVTGVQAAGHATGKDVWQQANFGLPGAYTVDAENGQLKFDIPFDDDYAGENIYMDYYTKLPVYNSDADILDEPEYDLFINYLKWKIKYKQSGGKIKQQEDPDYLDWVVKKKAFINKERLGQEIYFTPDF